MVVGVICVRPISAPARRSSITASRPRRRPALTTRRRSSIEMSSAITVAIASQSPAAMYAWQRASTRLAVFSRRGPGRLSSSNLASAASRSWLVEQFAAVDPCRRRPSTRRSLATRRRSPVATLPVPRLRRPLRGCSADGPSRRRILIVRLIVPRGRKYASQITGREGASRAPVVDVHQVRRRRGKLVSVDCGEAPAINDHVCACAAASPAR